MCDVVCAVECFSADGAGLRTFILFLLLSSGYFALIKGHIKVTEGIIDIRVLKLAGYLGKRAMRREDELKRASLSLASGSSPRLDCVPLRVLRPASLRQLQQEDRCRPLPLALLVCLQSG